MPAVSGELRPADDPVLGLGERDRAVAHLRPQRVLEPVLVEGVLVRLGPEVPRIRRRAAELQRDQVIELESGGGPAAIPVGLQLLQLQRLRVAGRRPDRGGPAGAADRALDRRLGDGGIENAGCAVAILSLLPEVAAVRGVDSGAALVGSVVAAAVLEVGGSRRGLLVGGGGGRSAGRDQRNRNEQCPKSHESETPRRGGVTHRPIPPPALRDFYGSSLAPRSARAHPTALSAMVSG